MVVFEPLVQLLDLGAHLHAQLGVEVGQRLVEQEDLRIAHDGAAHGDALALAAGELARIARRAAARARGCRRPARPAASISLFGVRLAASGEKPMFSRDRHVRIERVVLEHHGDVAVLRRQSLTTRPPMRISPAVMSSSPAIMRSSVDLPQPDGPTRTTNSPSSMRDVDAMDHRRRRRRIS